MGIRYGNAVNIQSYLNSFGDNYQQVEEFPFP